MSEPTTAEERKDWSRLYGANVDRLIADIERLEAENLDESALRIILTKRMGEFTTRWKKAHPGAKLVWPDVGTAFQYVADLTARVEYERDAALEQVRQQLSQIQELSSRLIEADSELESTRKERDDYARFNLYLQRQYAAERDRADNLQRQLG